MQPQLRIGLNTSAAVVGKVQEGSEAQVTVLGSISHRVFRAWPSRMPRT